MSGFERRMQIVERMKIRKFDTAFSLASEFWVSYKTILRDVRKLSLSGYPIIADPGYGGGIRWLGGKRQFPFMSEEVEALQEAIKAVSMKSKIVLENMLRDNTPPEVKITNNDIFELLLNGKSQSALAAELGITGAYLSYLLSGRRKLSAKMAERISKFRSEIEKSGG